VLYVLAALVWGTPAVAGLADVSRDDGPPLLHGLGIVTLALLFFSYIVLAQLLVYLSILYWLPRRRLVAILLSPLAVGVMFVFAQGVLEAAIVLVAGASYGASLWFPQGPPAWWRRRPRLVPLAAVIWLAITAAVAIVQTFPAGVRSDVDVTVRDAGRTARYRLACEYDRAGRVRAPAEVERPHPGGERACELLDFAERSLEDGPSYLQLACPAGARSGRFSGRVRGRRFDEEIIAAECQETFFVDGETSVLVPPVPSD
jgi:hypothetical protein